MADPSGDRAQQQALCALAWYLPTLELCSLPPRVLPQAPTSLSYLLLPRDLTHQLLAHQEQFAWELGYPLNSLHQVPNYLEQEQERTEVGTSNSEAGASGSAAPGGG